MDSIRIRNKRKLTGEDIISKHCGAPLVNSELPLTKRQCVGHSNVPDFQVPVGMEMPPVQATESSMDISPGIQHTLPSKPQRCIRCMAGEPAHILHILASAQ